MGAAAIGMHNLLLLTGDDPKAGDQPETKPVFDLNSTALTAMAAAMRDRGELPTGRKIAGKADFFLGAADVPVDPQPGWKPDKLQPRSPPAPSSRRPSSAWMPAIVRRYTARLAETRRRAIFI